MKNTMNNTLNFPMDTITYNNIEKMRKEDFLTKWQEWFIDKDNFVIADPTFNCMRCQLTYDEETQTATITSNEPLTMRQSPTHYIICYKERKESLIDKRDGHIEFPPITDDDLDYGDRDDNDYHEYDDSNIDDNLY